MPCVKKVKKANYKQVDVDKMEIETLRMKLKVYDLTNVWINMDLAILIFQYTFVLI